MYSTHKINIHTASSAIVLLAVSVLLSSCMRNTREELHEVEIEQERATFTVQNLHTFVTDTGVYKYEFETPDLAQYDNAEEPYTDFPHGLKFKMFSDGGKTIRSRIRCNNARYFKQQNLWELNNDVEAVTAKNEILNTEQLYWNTAEHRIYSDKFVKITTATQVITGIGFESDEKMSKYEIKHPGGEISVADSKGN
ncbi:MAG: LPS export ABC transporter periplasmic protein LptC [Marinilabiliaceae bacterium]|jgi:LPS export ABC transporter protein LptC|nr:LPS export ABC transporter periplasmic protein LptC [Bacteroidales bacterium]MCR5697578.1 LPS export ABC transporter periplasmic protein LptC [Marinilabiliaceae bacterium]